MRIRTMLAIGLTAVGLVAATAVTSPAGAAGQRSQQLTFTTVVTSQANTLTKLPGGHVFGWNDLAGPTTWGGQAATLDFLATVNYVDDSGPFTGVVTVTRADGVRLAFSVEGAALAVTNAAGLTRTSFTGALTVIQGTGSFRDSQGIGVMTGSRAAALGSPVELTFDLDVRLRG